MPQLLRIGPYSIYFWSNEGDPLEPIHVHISEGRAKSTATKIWITSTGNVILSNNNSQIPERILKKLMRMIAANSDDIHKRIGLTVLVKINIFVNIILGLCLFLYLTPHISQILCESVSILDYLLFYNK